MSVYDNQQTSSLGFSEPDLESDSESIPSIHRCKSQSESRSDTHTHIQTRTETHSAVANPQELHTLLMS